MTRRYYSKGPSDGCFLILVWVSNSIQMCETLDQSSVQINNQEAIAEPWLCLTALRRNGAELNCTEH